MADFCNTYSSFFLLIRLLEMRLQGNYSKGECFVLLLFLVNIAIQIIIFETL